jgi:hypothetical protein
MHQAARFMQGRARSAALLRAMPHDPWLDVGGILSYPVADHGVGDICCTGSLALRWYIPLPGEWLLDDRRRAPALGLQPPCEEGYHGFTA